MIRRTRSRQSRKFFRGTLECLEQRWAPALLDPLTQPRFVNTLPIPGILQPTSPGGTSYEVPILQVQQDLGLINPNNGQPFLTTVWGYNGVYPGPTVVAQRDQAIDIRWSNQLTAGGSPLPHLLAEELMEPLPATGVPLVTHLHGGHTASASDGLPMAWSTPNFAETGPDFRLQTFHYENDQLATTLWYHDHAMGITRLNVYAGLAGAYLIREPWETTLQLPSGPYEVPLIIQDRSFTDDGELTYPPMTMTAGSVGDFVLVNGKAWPAMDVEPRKYRFRMLNGADSRFFNLGLSVVGGGTAPAFAQIGTDQGFLEQTRWTSTLLMTPAERADVIIDFSDPNLAGKTIIVTNAAPAPFPSGSSPNPATVGQVMAFRVTAPLSGPDTSQVPTSLRPLINPESAVTTRQLILSLGMHMGQMGLWLGTVAEGRMMYDDPATEVPGLNDTEVWEVYNTSPAAHPVHLHLTPFRVLNRQTFTATTNSMTGALSNIQLTGPVLAPRPESEGAKDTVIVDPGQVLRLVAKFDRAGEYVWHCHMLAHEDMEMMRPLVVLPKLTVNDVAVVEGHAGTKNAVFTLSLNGPGDEPVTVNYATAPGSAAADVDFGTAVGSVTIPAGATTATVTVPIFGDNDTEPDETFFLNLTGAANALIADAQAQGTIINDDPPIPRVQAVVVNDGSPQRSRVDSIRVQFDTLATLPGQPADAFQLKRQIDGAIVTCNAAVSNTTTTQVTLTFTGGPVEYGGLADGRYTLTVFAAAVNAAGGALDGNGDGTPGDDYVLSGSPGLAPNLFRLFGDYDGDGDTDTGDFAAFRTVFGGSSMAFDFDNDGDVDTSDFGQFRTRFGSAV